MWPGYPESSVPLIDYIGLVIDTKAIENPNKAHGSYFVLLLKGEICHTLHKSFLLVLA